MKYNHGFTLIETLVGLGIFILLVGIVSGLGRDIFYHNYNISQNLVAESEAKIALAKLSRELRSTQTAITGAYPLESVSSSSLTFYSDINNSGKPARLRYFVEGNDLKRGVVVPTGEPYVYDLPQESVKTVISNLLATTTPIYSFFNNAYYGADEVGVLGENVEIKDIRLVRINFFIRPDNRQPSNYYELTSQVMLRNLKDNL